MNLALSDEQVLLREAARGVLSRFKTLEEAAPRSTAAARRPTCGPTAREAGWPGLLIDESHGGAGLDVFDAMLVLSECGRVLAAVPLLGHLPATAILSDSPAAGAALLGPLASGEHRAAYLPARPGDDLSGEWSADPAHGMERASLPTAVRDGADGQARVTGQVAFVPDAPGADVLVGVALLDGHPTGFAVESSAAGVSVEAVHRYDATRALGHVTLKDAPATVLDTPEAALAAAWHLAQALIAAESLGAVETALDVSVAYAKERFTFGRAIGSYQAVKHSLTEVLRQLEERPLAALLRRLVAPLGPRGVRARGGRRALGGRPRARPRGAHDDLRARGHRRHVGARRPAVLPPRPALPPLAGRHRARLQPGGLRADRAG